MTAKKLGRPTKYRKEMCEEIIKHMATGLSKEASAAKIGIVKDTLYNWVKKHKSFSDAIKQGEAENLVFWESVGTQGATGRLPGFNAAAWIFNMRNRHKWSNKDPEENLVGDMAQALSKLADKLPD